MVVQIPLAGSYSSALAEGLKLLSSPPATRTMPLGSKVAVWFSRASLRLPVVVQLPLAGSYSSALAEGLKLLSSPPATRTMPLGSKVAVWNRRAVLRLPVKLQVPLAGSSLLDNLATGIDPKRSGSATALCLVVVRCPSANGITQTANSRSR